MLVNDPAEYQRRINEVILKLKEIADRNLDQYSPIQQLPKNCRNLELRAKTGPFPSKSEFNRFVREVENHYGLRSGCLSVNHKLRKAKTIEEMAEKIANSPNYKSEEEISQKEDRGLQELAQIIYEECGVPA